MGPATDTSYKGSPHRDLRHVSVRMNRDRSCDLSLVCHDI